MELSKVFKTETGRIIMSVLLGLGLATLFRKSCQGKNCIIFKPPSLEDIKKKKYKYGDKCFNYEIDTVVCDNKKKYVDFA